MSPNWQSDPAPGTSQAVCAVCGGTDLAVLHPGFLVNPAVAELIRETRGSWDPDGWICSTDLLRFQHAYSQALREKAPAELTEPEKEHLQGLRLQEIVSRNPLEDSPEGSTFGQRMADRIARVGGSWKFILGFVLVMIVWICVNTLLLLTRSFDPYPFILLNLVLSCLAALQAPVIMMSQNRQEARDRRITLRDYQVNLKAELEIRQLNRKLDHLLTHQWKSLDDIQRTQAELLEKLSRR